MTDMEEIRALSEREGEELLASLKEAEAEITAGKAIDYDPKKFQDRLIGICRNARR
jgi:hypothetical protein